jgi:hypothetical protein
LCILNPKTFTPVALKEATDSRKPQWFAARYKVLGSYNNFKGAVTVLLRSAQIQTWVCRQVYQGVLEKAKEEKC